MPSISRPDIYMAFFRPGPRWNQRTRPESGHGTQLRQTLDGWRDINIADTITRGGRTVVAQHNVERSGLKVSQFSMDLPAGVR